MLGFAAWFANPTPFQLRVFVTALALAAGGIGAVIPGLLDIRYKGVVRAAGALGLVALVFFFQPTIERHVPRLIDPQTSPEPAAQRYLSAVDRREYDAAWTMLPAEFKKVVDNDFGKYRELYRTERERLGDVKQRTLSGMERYESPPGFPVGLYRGLTYRTHFAGDGRERIELVLLQATPELTWQVVSHRLDNRPL